MAPLVAALLWLVCGCLGEEGACLGSGCGVAQPADKYSKDVNTDPPPDVVFENLFDEKGQFDHKLAKEVLEAAGEELPQDAAYKNLFDEDGKFNRDLAKAALEGAEYDYLEETALPEEGEEDVDHIRTPLYSIKLSSQYDDNLAGVHLMNKYQQKWAMDEFVAGKMDIFTNLFETTNCRQPRPGRDGQWRHPGGHAH
jgi:hypothetical protein